jgi:SET domain-containing protein
VTSFHTNKPFIRENLRIGWDEKIYGWGVFTSQNIPQFTVVETCPVVVYPKEILEIAAWNAGQDKHRFASLGLSLYSLKWDDSFLAIPLGYGGIYNHSDSKNCQFMVDKEKGFLHIVTLRDIEENEQLLVHYGDEWFDDKPFRKIDL